MTERGEVEETCGIFVDKEGTWYYRGVEMVRRDFLEAFFKNLKMPAKDKYAIELNGQMCLLEVEDTVFVVRRVEEERGQYRILLNDGTVEELSPEGFGIGKGGALYCRVKKGAFPARFSRPAYYQLAANIEEEDGNYFLPFKGSRILVATLQDP